MKFIKAFFNNWGKVGSTLCELSLTGETLTLYKIIIDEFKPYSGESKYCWSQDMNAKPCITGKVNPLAYSYGQGMQLIKVRATDDNGLIALLLTRNDGFQWVDIDVPKLISSINSENSSIDQIISKHFDEQLKVEFELQHEERRKLEQAKLEKVRERFK